MGRIRNFFGGNSYTVAASEEEKMTREKVPLLLHPNESIEMAFKNAFDGRDKSYFTSHRILIQKGLGLINKKRKDYLSIPYDSIEGFAITTASGFWDGDTLLEVWGTFQGESLKIDFGKNEVNLFDVQQFLNDKVLNKFKAATDNAEDEVVMSDGHKKASGFFSWLGGLDDAKQTDPDVVSKKFKEETPILMKHEVVELAFKTIRDFVVITSHRFLQVDVQGLRGKRTEFISYTWPSIAAITVRTAGNFLDRDTEMILHTTVPSRPTIEQDFRKGKADLWAIYKALGNKILGPDVDPMADVGFRGGTPNPGWLTLFKDRPLDAKQMNEVFHTKTPILQSNERVEMAFKNLRDIMLFTSKRVVKVDVQGLTGKRIEYTSIPWSRIVAFGGRTAGKYVDMDVEAYICTEMMFVPERKVNVTDENGEIKEQVEPKKPGMSMWTMQFNKNHVDVVKVKKYMALRCIRANQEQATFDMPTSSPTTETSMNFLSGWIGNQKEVDPTEINTTLHSKVDILLDDETVVMAFRAGRDLTLFTNLRIMVMDVQGLSGKQVEYRSTPYSSIRAFGVQSAGSWDLDSEVRLFTGNLWDLNQVTLDFRKGRADVLVIQKLLSSLVFGSAADAANFLDSKTTEAATSSSIAGLESFTTWITSNTTEKASDEYNEKLHKDTPLLLENETVSKVYKMGRDYYIYTSKRLLLLDVKGLLGKKVEYMSIPLKFVTGYEVGTAGYIDRDAEMYIMTNIPLKRKLQQDILVKSGDIMELNQYFTDKLFFSE